MSDFNHKLKCARLQGQVELLGEIYRVLDAAMLPHTCVLDILPHSPDRANQLGFTWITIRLQDPQAEDDIYQLSVRIKDGFKDVRSSLPSYFRDDLHRMKLIENVLIREVNWNKVFAKASL